ncbi:hypothetical protein [Flavobacterium pedocola]
MKKTLLLLLLSFGSYAIAQDINTEKANKAKLEEAFKTQEHNYSLLEKLLAANTVEARKNKTTNNDSDKGNFYKELCELYANFKAANKNFYTFELTPKQYASIEAFHKVRLAKLDSLYALRDRSLHVTVQTEKETEVVKGNQIPYKSDLSYVEPSHENCKNLNPSSGESCVSHLFRKSIAYSYQIPEYRFEEEGVKTTIILGLKITQNGDFVLNSIINSSKYFEFDMEAILATERFAKRYKFSPGTSNGKAVAVLYACPISIMTMGNE